LRNAPLLTPVPANAVDEALFRSFRASSANLEGLKRKSKKKMIIGVTAVSILLLLVLVSLFYFKSSSRSAVARPSVMPLPAATNTQMANTLKPSPLTQLATGTQPATNTQPAATEAAPPPQVQSEMMNNQLTAPTRIQHNISTAAGKEAPPSPGFGAASMEGLGGNSAIGNVFNGQSQAKVNVEAPSKVNISAGVAVGLLVQKTAPVYPLIAKTAHVSGTVVLAAIISKTGSVKDLRVVSGPPMLRQAALDAVRTWRYKPYKLDNQLIEVETTININFSLGG
jgi:protein TonB